MLQRQLRKTAYEYVSKHMEKFHALPDDPDHPLVISLKELILLKEGLADPSAELVTSLKRLLRGAVTEAEIDAYLVAPFVKR